MSMTLLESLASELAAKLKLKYYGYGRYGKNGTVTHHVEFGRLVPVRHEFSVNAAQLKHLEHVEDFVFNHGVNGTRHAMALLHATHQHIHNKESPVRLRTKIDGAPSSVWNADENSIATKSGFAKTPKVNKTPEEVEANHGHAPGLVSKLKAGLEHFPKLGLKGTWQGDMLYTKDDLKMREIDGVQYVTFKPNTITYAVPANSDMGKRILNSKIGIVFHTSYDKDGKMDADPDTSHIKGHPDVFTFDNTYKPSSSDADISDHLSDIGRIFARVPKETFDLFSDPEYQTMIKTFINRQVRDDNQDYNVDDLVDFVNTNLQKEVDKVKTDKAKALKDAKRQITVAKLKSMKSSINDMLMLHQRIGQAKDHLITSLDQNQSMRHFIEKDGQLEPTNPEGYVVIGPRGIGKLVRRSEFSKNNFNLAKEWTGTDKPKNTTATLLFGRMNPVTVGHVANIKHALSIPGADPHIIVSHSQDIKKNPLSGQEKRELLKKVFPSVDVQISDSTKPTALHWAAHLCKQGYKKLVVVGGSDRDGMLETIKKYNGVYDKNGNGYYFPEGIEASSSGERVAGISGTDMRNHALSGNETMFKRGIPEELHDDAKDIMAKIKARIGK